MGTHCNSNWMMDIHAGIVFDCIEYNSYDGHSLMELQDEHTIQQFTNQFDKNGREIWEGDIIKTLPDEQINDGVFQIKYERASYSDILAFHPIDKLNEVYNHYYGNWDGRNFEVIGNIFENPELLEDGISN